MNRINRIILVLFALVMMIPIASFIPNPNKLDASYNMVLNYQGKLTNTSNVAVADGTYNMEFKLYDAVSSGTLLWTETRTGGNKVQVTNGIFSVMLGDVTSLSSVDFNQTLFLSVNIGGTGSPSWDGEMSPRKKLGTVPAAFVSNSVIGTGLVNTVNTSATALTIAASGSNYGLQVDESTSSAVTGLKIKPAAAGAGLALSVINGNTDENLTFDAKGAGTVNINGTATGDILLGGGSGSTGCTITNSSGALTCTAGGNFTTLGLSGAITGATGITSSGTITFSGLGGSGVKCLHTDNSGIITAATADCGTGTGGISLAPGSADSTASTNSAINVTDTGLTGNQFINLKHTTSTFTGTGLLMDFANATGAFSGNFVDFRNNTTSKFSVSSAGALTAASTINGLTLSSTALTAAAGLTVTATAANLAFTTTTSGDITLAPASTGSVAITSGVTTGTTTSAGLVLNANSLASGTGLYIASSTLSSGSLVDFQVSGTAGASSQKVLNITTTGAITGTQTTYGGFFSNTHSGGTSTNVGLYVTATSGTNNYAAIFDAGSVGIGTTGPDRKLDILDASSPQLRLTTTDGTVYLDMQNTSNSNLIISGNTLASSSASQSGLQITPTINQTSTATYRALDINVTETATTSQTDLNRLADFRVGGSSKVAISNNGSITLQNAANLVTPYGGIGDFQNHLVRSEEFDNASWVKTNVSAPTANTQVAPDGSTSAESLATSSSGGDVCQWSGTAAGSSTFTFSVWARSTSGTQNFDMRLDAGATSCATANNVTGTAVTQIATTSWQRFTVTQTFSSATGNVKARIFPGGTGGTGTIYAWAAQVDKSTKPSNYVMTTSGAITNTNRGQLVESNLATASGFSYGGRSVTTLTGAIAASSVTDGQLIRVIDNATGTDDTETVRALEVQSYSGSNLNGVNTAVAAFGYTFGVHAVSTGQANESAQPAAVFADLDNGSAPTQGNAIRAYSDNLTSTDLVSFYQESSGFTGNGLVMNFANNSGTFTGKFISLKKANTESFHVDNDGSTFVSFTGTGTANAVCHTTNGNTNNDELVDCSSAPAADFAEMYPVEHGIDIGDIVTTGTEMVNTYDILPNGNGVNWNTVKGKISKLQKSTRSYQQNILGIVSDNYSDFISTGYNIKPQDNPKSIALKGRVNVKVTNENGPIKAGDYITASATVPGAGMKATRSGQIVGQALADFDDDHGIVMIFVQVGYQSIGNTIVLDAPSTNNIDLQNSSSSSLTNTASTFVIQQQSSGNQGVESDILKLQAGDASRFMVSSTGATSILTNLNCDTNTKSCPSVLKVVQHDTELMNIDARGTLTLAGAIVIKDDSFAGSVATDKDGLAEVAFSFNLGTGKPVVELTTESKTPVLAQIVEFKQDKTGNYIGFVMKTFNFSSEPVEAIVHYTVIGKEAGYLSLGQVSNSESDLPTGNSNNTDPVSGNEGLISTGNTSSDGGDVPAESGTVGGESTGSSDNATTSIN